MGSAVTTLKNTVDHIVTEYGVAELRGKSIRDRTTALIAVAHPKFREELEVQARQVGYV
jgi:acyl-CoA hydrolase